MREMKDSGVEWIGKIPKDWEIVPLTKQLDSIVDYRGKTPEKTEFALMEAIPKHRWSHSHHVLIFHGRRMCKARKPECEICLIKDDCDFYQGKE